MNIGHVCKSLQAELQRSTLQWTQLLWSNFKLYFNRLSLPLQYHCPHMVRLLHHYETSTHRIFLLLEYVQGGRLLDFVNGKREQWKKLHEAVTNPPPSSTLILSSSIQGARGKSESSLVIKDNRTAVQANGKGVWCVRYINNCVCWSLARNTSTWMFICCICKVTLLFWCGSRKFVWTNTLNFTHDGGCI